MPTICQTTKEPKSTSLLVCATKTHCEFCAECEIKMNLHVGKV